MNSFDTFLILSTYLCVVIVVGALLAAAVVFIISGFVAETRTSHIQGLQAAVAANVAIRRKWRRAALVLMLVAAGALFLATLFTLTRVVLAAA